MTTAVAVKEKTEIMEAYTGEQIQLIKDTVAKGATDTELKLFLYQAGRTGLDPLAKQIHSVKRWNAAQQRNEMAIQTGIDGYRLIADRTGAYCGNDDPVFEGECDADYDKKQYTHPAVARVTVYKLINGTRCPFTASARWQEYYPGDKQGFMWRKLPYLMLGKCAEALALRKAFPAELSGIYTNEEMDQAGPQGARVEPRVVQLVEPAADAATTVIPQTPTEPQAPLPEVPHEEAGPEDNSPPPVAPAPQPPPPAKRLLKHKINIDGKIMFTAGITEASAKILIAAEDKDKRSAMMKGYIDRAGATKLRELTEDEAQELIASLGLGVKGATNNDWDFFNRKFWARVDDLGLRQDETAVKEVIYKMFSVGSMKDLAPDAYASACEWMDEFQSGDDFREYVSIYLGD